MGALSARLVRRRGFAIDARLECAPGELLAIAGPSGGGKSTMLRMIAGLERIEAGEVRCGAERWAGDALHLPPERRRVGLVFQHYALFPHLDAAANVAVALGHLPRRARRARAAELLALANLEGLDARRPAALSGGQRQRVALARALARTEAPGDGVLLLDEPFAAVDAAVRERLHRELARLRTRLERPVLLVTHDLREVLRLADRVAVVHRGTTLDAGPVERVTTRPASVRVARLLGHKNVLPARALGVRDGALELELEPIGARVRMPAANAPAPLREPGAAVALLVPASGIVLHRVDRASRGERENPVTGTVAELVRLGDEIELAVRLHAAGTTAPAIAPAGAHPPHGGAGSDRATPMLHFRLSRHVGARNALAEGRAVGLSLVAEELHALPAPGTGERPDAAGRKLDRDAGRGAPPPAR